MKKRIIGSLLTGIMVVSAMAQVSNTVSPYSQFGMGILTDQSQGFNRGMGGLSMGMRAGNIVNMKNPASYSAIDSLTMIFDFGLSGQITNFKEGGKRVNGRTGSFDYGIGAFRLLPKVGVSFGIVPFSSIGYNYSRTEKIGSDTFYEEHEGDGGFTQAFIGAGWEIVKGFSVGMNLSYFWGRYDKEVALTSSDYYVNTLMMSYETSVSSYKLDFGVQWQKAIDKNNVLTLGATMGVGHNLKADADLEISNIDAMTEGLPEDSIRTAHNAFSLPFTVGFGATWCRNNSLTVGFDYQLQAWGSHTYPMMNESTKTYENIKGILKDRHQFVVGADWIPDPSPLNRKFLKRIHYRLGLSYATPYYKIGGVNGPKELAVSAGFGIPIVNSWNNRSTLNISAQWVRSSVPSMITENTFRINIGLTFNERWFAKWKVD